MQMCTFPVPHVGEGLPFCMECQVAHEHGCIIALPASEFFQPFYPKSVQRTVLCNWPEIIVLGRQSSHHLHLMSLLLCDADRGLVRAGPQPPPTTSCCELRRGHQALREGLLIAGNTGQSGWSRREREADWRKRRAGGRLEGAQCVFGSSVHLFRVLSDMVTFGAVWQCIEGQNTGITPGVTGTIFNKSTQVWTAY